ncbi:AhpC/TSA family [Popillia japonica]|uniref:thioredoxin-dependent peroxiredoxin n=1 Tax=Popillia japonica TaxID=7064 RepID=A0AAW1IZ03_POPJA
MAGIFTSLVRKVPQLISITTPKFNTLSALRTLSVSSPLCSARVRQPAPNFEGMACIEDNFKKIKLSDYAGKYVLLVFYPLDFTFVCPTELIALEQMYDEFHKLDCEVIAISVDSHYTHLAWQHTPRDQGGVGKLRFPLLSDINKNIAKDYGVLLEDEGVALRGMFLIDSHGLLRVTQINDLSIGRSTEEALRLVGAIKAVEEFGEVCPANWKTGSKTIKPDPVGSKEYFKTVHT